jgi:phosphate starvation-inducible PhoH-like protein
MDEAFRALYATIRLLMSAIVALIPAAILDTTKIVPMTPPRIISSSLKATIVMTRPNVEAGRGFGFLKGELQEKFAPYIEPLLDVLNERFGKSHTEYLVKRGAIQFKPLEFLRGKTFSNCLYILDEAQNTTPSQMKLFLSRVGEDTKVIIDGDIEQKDINGMSGLEDAINRLSDIEQIGIVRFTVDDVVRSGICKEILLAYRN